MNTMTAKQLRTATFDAMTANFDSAMENHKPQQTMKEHTHRATLNKTEDLGTFTRSDALLMKMSYQHITLEEIEPELAPMSKKETETFTLFAIGVAFLLIGSILAYVTH